MSIITMAMAAASLPTRELGRPHQHHHGDEMEILVMVMEAEEQHAQAMVPLLEAGGPPGLERPDICVRLELRNDLLVSCQSVRRCRMEIEHALQTLSWALM